MLIIAPIIALVTLWEWPIYWVTGQLFAGLLLSPDNGETANL